MVTDISPGITSNVYGHDLILSRRICNLYIYSYKLQCRVENIHHTRQSRVVLCGRAGKARGGGQLSLQRGAFSPEQFRFFKRVSHRSLERPKPERVNICLKD